MTLALLALVPIGAAAIWAFVRLGPVDAEPAWRRRFDAVALGVAGLAAAAWCVRTYLVMSSSVDAPWWPVVAALGGLLLVPLVLAVAAAARVVVVPRRRPGPTSR